MILAEAPIAHVAEIDSTSREAERRALAGEIGPLWIRADRQTAGRGRRGRVWADAPGNLKATYLGSAEVTPQALALLGFAAALALCDLADAFAPGAETRLKWPNDLLLNGRKAAGVLLESGARAGSTGELWFALGIGINLAEAPPGVEPAPTAFAAFAEAPPDPDAAFALLRARLAAWSGRLAAEGFGPIRAAWEARGPAWDDPLEARIGAERLIGCYAGLADDGALRLATPQGVRLIAAGEVFAVPAPGV